MIGRLCTYGHGEGPCPQPIERKRNALGHLQEESKGKGKEREVLYLRTCKDYLYSAAGSSLIFFLTDDDVLSLLL